MMVNIMKTESATSSCISRSASILNFFVLNFSFFLVLSRMNIKIYSLLFLEDDCHAELFILLFILTDLSKIMIFNLKTSFMSE